MSNEVIHQVAAEVRQAMQPYVLTVGRLEDDVQQLKTTLYGNPAIRLIGLVERFDQMDDKLDQLIKQSHERSAQMTGARKAFTILAAVIAVVGGPQTIITLLRAFGISI